jgi:hypothetical protein
MVIKKNYTKIHLGSLIVCIYGVDDKLRNTEALASESLVLMRVPL